MADLTYVLATTARPRDSLKPVRGPEEAGAELRARHLGRAGRRHPLRARALRPEQRRDRPCRRDRDLPGQPRLRLAEHRAGGAPHELRVDEVGRAAPAGRASPRRRSPPAEKDDLQRFLDHLEGMLDDAGYFHPPEKRSAMSQKVRTILTKTALQRGRGAHAARHAAPSGAPHGAGGAPVVERAAGPPLRFRDRRADGAARGARADARTALPLRRGRCRPFPMATGRRRRSGRGSSTSSAG